MDKIYLFIYYLSDLLKKEIGRVVKDYINDFVVEKVKNLLFGINEIIMEIVYDFGFNYLYYFICLFKFRMGVILLEFRNFN